MFGRIVQCELKVLLVQRWKRNRHDVFYLVGEVFKKRIEAGEVVHVGKMSTDLDGGTWSQDRIKIKILVKFAGWCK